MTAATLYDGCNAVPHAVLVARDGDGLRIAHADETAEHVPAASLVTADRRPGLLVLGRPGVDGWRLRIVAPPAEIDALFPKGGGYGRWIDRIGLWPAAAAFAGISAVLLAIGYMAPAALAPLVPRSAEKAYGDALIGDFGGEFCKNPAGLRALDTLARRLTPEQDDIRVRVVDVPLVNAVALPAGNIVVFDGLLKNAEGPDELAGVLAHEIAHVRKRHVTAALLRQFGVGMLTSMLGGTTGGRVDSVVALSFTRGAEREADTGAIEMLRAAGVSPVPTARFFQRLAKDEAAVGRLTPAMAYLSSHPLSADRERRFEQAAKPGEAYTPALDAADWAALRGICGSRPAPGK